MLTKKKTKKKNRLLYTLAFLGDFLEEINDPFGLCSLPLKEVYGFIPSKYKKHNFRSAYYHAISIGNMEKIIKNGEVYFRLTSQGKDKFIRDFPLSVLNKKIWDRKWRMLIFDIEEKRRKNRDFLRFKISSLGFGKIQKSVYISPFCIESEIKDFLKNNGLEKEARVFITEKNNLKEARLISEEIWKLSRLNEKYFEMYQELNKETSINKIRDLKAKYIDTLLIDPFLPKELLPVPWYREEIKKLLKLKEKK